MQVSFYEKASDLGDREAKFQLAKIYQEGEDEIPKNLVKTIKLYQEFIEGTKYKKKIKKSKKKNKKSK